MLPQFPKHPSGQGEFEPQKQPQEQEVEEELEVIEACYEHRYQDVEAAIRRHPHLIWRVKDDGGRTIAHFAARDAPHLLQSMWDLLLVGAQQGITSKEGALLRAVFLEAKTCDSSTPMVWAAVKCRVESFEFFFQRFPDAAADLLQCMDNDGMTVLHWIVCYSADDQRRQCVKGFELLVLHCGAAQVARGLLVPTVWDVNETPLQLIVAKKSTELRMAAARVLASSCLMKSAGGQCAVPLDQVEALAKEFMQVEVEMVEDARVAVDSAAADEAGGECGGLVLVVVFVLVEQSQLLQRLCRLL